MFSGGFDGTERELNDFGILGVSLNRTAYRRVL
jgi:hypothetical protein